MRAQPWIFGREVVQAKGAGTHIPGRGHKGPREAEEKPGWLGVWGAEENNSAELVF